MRSKLKKVAYVTGGMGGIGTTICRKLHDSGHKVIAGCGPNRDYKLWLDKQKIDGYEFYPSVGNVSDWNSTKEAFEEVVETHGFPLILVNNAGITRDSVFLKMNIEQWTSVIDTNLNSLFNVTKQVIKGMIEKGWGRIINISSVNGQKGQFAQANYAASKAGDLGMTKTLAQEGARYGITANAICPGYIDTDMVKDLSEKVIDSIVAQIPAGRLGQAEEIARCVVFLAADSSGFINGATLNANGAQYLA